MGAPTARPGPLRYGLAVACVVLGWIAREALTPALGPTALPFVSFFPAIALAAWFGGLGPGVLAVVLAAFAAAVFFVEPSHSVAITSIHDLVALLAFLVASGFIVTAFETMHRELRRRRRLERELGASRDLHATTLASIGDAVIVTDAAGRVTFLNTEAERLTGWEAAEAVGKPLDEVFAIVDELTRRPAENPVEKALRLGTVVGLANHTLLLARDGTEIPIDDSAAPIRLGDGPIDGVVLVFRDVSEQRSFQEARARLAAIVQSSADAIFTKDLDGTIQTWNPGAERLFGYRPDEIVGKPITMLVPPERLDEEIEILGRLRRGQPSERLETERIAKDGRRIPVSVSISPLRDADGRVIGASKIVHDVTDVVAAREALERERELLATTLASIGDAVIVTDARGRITFLNGEAERLTGWHRSDAKDRALPEVFRIVDEEKRQRLENPVEKVMRAGGVVGLANHTILLRKDGSEVPIDDSAAPIVPEGREFSGVVLVFRDITERKRAEESLRQADRKKDEFLAILSHELRNPLAPIRLAVSMLQKVGPAQRELQEYRDVIDRQARQLSRLLDDLLDVGRITSGKIVLRKEGIRLGAAVASAIESIQPLIDSLGHELIVQLPPHSIDVEGDLTRLAQVFSNLLNNAAKYTDKGGRILLAVELHGSEVLVRVRDTGIGIGADQLPRIFDMFAQVDGSSERGRGGLGVGLTLARRLVELHGGSITASSAGLGKGSEFVVRLPALAALPPRPPEPRVDSERPSGRCRILVADDNVDSASVLGAALRLSGHEVEVAYDGHAALEAARRLEPDAALLDVGMPGLSGHELARRIRSDRGTGILLVAITGWGQEEDKRLALESGFDFHLTKPVDLERVEMLLATHDPRQAGQPAAGRLPEA